MPQTNQHNIDLIEACKKGNSRAQVEIYNSYCKAMYNTAYRIVKSDFEAEDIMQDAFLTAFSKLKTLKEPAFFGSWLKKIVINNSIAHYKSKKRKNEVPYEQMTYRMETESNETENEAYTNLKAEHVLETMKELKGNYRLALTLHLIEGYDYHEIGAIMDISYGNCRTVISRAKESLRKKISTINGIKTNDEKGLYR